jgi:hypothetical protein
MVPGPGISPPRIFVGLRGSRDAAQPYRILAPANPVLKSQPALNAAIALLWNVTTTKRDNPPPRIMTMYKYTKEITEIFIKATFSHTLIVYWLSFMCKIGPVKCLLLACQAFSREACRQPAVPVPV